MIKIRSPLRTNPASSTIPATISRPTNFTLPVGRVGAPDNGTPVTPLPLFDFDAVVMIGDSITNQTFQFQETRFQAYAESIGFPSTIKFYGTGLSGHTTKTFTEAWALGIGATPNRTLSDYETLLAGKKVMFISLLGANDVNDLDRTGNQSDYDASLAIVKAEVETWSETLRDSILNSSLDASFAIAAFPYVDWRPGATMRSDGVYDIIEGSVPFYDQQDYSSKVVNPTATNLTPDFVSNGKPVFDFYGIVRNAFRFSIADSEGVHPAGSTSQYMVRKFTDVLYKWYSESTIDKINLYPYPSTTWNVSESCVLSADIDYNGNFSPKDYTSTNILALAAREGVVGSCLTSSTDGRRFGKAYAYTDIVNFSNGTANTGNTTTSLDNELLTSTNLRSNDTRNIFFDNLPQNSTFTVTICSSVNVDGDIKIVDLGNPSNTIEIPDTRARSAGDHKTGSMSGVQSDSDGKIQLSVESITPAQNWYLAGIQLTRTA